MCRSLNAPLLVLSHCALSFVLADTIVHRLYVFQKAGESREMSNDAVVECGS